MCEDLRLIYSIMWYVSKVYFEWNHIYIYIWCVYDIYIYVVPWQEVTVSETINERY